MRTRDKLAAELRKQAESAPEAKARTYRSLAARAAEGEFDDYAMNEHICPVMALYNELKDAGLDKFAKRVAAGEFDATKEESDEWARSPAGQAAAAQLTPEMRRAFGFDRPN